MEEDNQQELTDATTFTDTSDICQQLLDRYGKSSAPQHRHLCATAAATRSIIQSESLPLTPLSYFAATIDAVSTDASGALDSNAISALSTFLGIVLPLVPKNSVATSKAANAVSILVELVDRPSEEAVSTASVRAVVKCLGVLVGFCDLEDWNSVKLGFETLLKFSIDRRPKIRKCAQDCLLKVFKSFKSSDVIKEASKFLFSLFKQHMPLAVGISALGTEDGRKDGRLSNPEHLDVLHLLNVLKLTVPYLSDKVNIKMFLRLHKLLSPQFSALTRHVFDIIEAMFETPACEGINREAESIIKLLASYMSTGEKNPVDTLLCAATLSKSALDKIYTSEPTKWISNLPLVFGSVAGLLTSEGSASQASTILKELINDLVDRSVFLNISDRSVNDEVNCAKDSIAMKSICSVFDDMLSTCDGIPNEHILAVISVLFLKFGKTSYVYMKSLVLKLAEYMTLACKDKGDLKPLEECIGSAVSAVGPENILALLPISVNAEDATCSNTWLIPILQNYVVGSSLGFFIQDIVPLAESFEHASQKVEKPVSGEDLQAHARGCWGLLSAFCRSPTDTYQTFGTLAKLLLTFLTKDSFLLENIAIALQELVSENRSALGSNEFAGEFAKVTKTCKVKDSSVGIKSKSSYSKKIASRNIKALASCSEDLLLALVDVFFDSPPLKRTYLKDAIGCLAPITDSAAIRKIFLSVLQRFRLVDNIDQCGKVGSSDILFTDKVPDDSTLHRKITNRCLMMELASSLVEGASKDFIGLIYSFIKYTLQDTDEIAQNEAYHTLSKVLEEHSWFYTSEFIDLIDFLLGLESPDDLISLKNRFGCFEILLAHAIKSNSDEESTKAFLILNEIILKMKDPKEEDRKAAYDVILGISSRLRNSSSALSDGPYHKLISMIIGYLSGSSPHIKSGAVSALSILVYNTADMCFVIPDLVPSVLALLQSKALEVIKAALGFVKVLVSTLEARDLQTFLSDAIHGVLPWSSNSRHHFRSKVTVILEIMMRKCGSAAVESLASGKYRAFVRSVSEGRHGKSSSKEGHSSDPQGKPTDPPPRGLLKRQKRKLEEPNISAGDDGSGGSQRSESNNRKGITSNKHELHKNNGSGNSLKRVKKPRYSSHDKMNEGPPQGNARKQRYFNMDQSGSGKRKMEQQKASKKSEAVDPIPGSATKFTKNKRVARKRHNSSK